MTELVRTRTIRPSTRLESSTSYKIDTSKVGVNDKLVVKIYHETENFEKTYEFTGYKVAKRNSIHFKVVNNDIVWTTVTPD